MKEKKNKEWDSIGGLVCRIKEMFSNILSINSKLEVNIKRLNASQEMLQKLAYYDSLTNLPNRTSFQVYLKEILEFTKGNKEKIGVMFMDVDHFKQINDTLGHDQGDLLLLEIGKRLRTIMSKGVKVFRLGGDEFVIVESKGDLKCIQETSRKVMKLFDKEFILDGGSYKISTSLGVSIYPDDGEDIKDIIKNADMAMYSSKEKGGGYSQFFTKDIKEVFIYRVKVEQGVRSALQNKEFILYYQPQINIKHGTIVSLEVLIRWNDSKFGTIMPQEFIKVAEETSLIIDIDRYVLMEACTQNKRWQDKGYKRLPISVNVSPRHFIDGEIVNSVSKALKVSGLEGKYLMLEITEGTLIKDFDKVINMVKELKKMGVNVSIDDFGSGYSSLSQLINLEISEVKIDKEFITGIIKDKKKLMVVKLIISLAHQLNLRVVAEGVETEDEVNYLKELQCDVLQGFYFSKPLCKDEVVKLIEIPLKEKESIYI